MERHKSFTSTAFENEGEPLTFELDGTTFTCRPAVGDGVLAIIGGMWFGTSEERGGAVGAFFRAAMEPTELKRFQDFVIANNLHEGVGDICIWLMEVYADRPTRQSPGSQNGHGEISPTSEASSSLSESETSLA